MKPLNRLIPIFYAATAIAGSAQVEPFSLDASDPKEIGKGTITSEQSAISPGTPFTVAIHLSHPEGWHSYYKNSGGIELPPEITWNLPDGFKAAALQWPTPELFASDFGTSIGYAEGPTLLAEITPPADLKPGTNVTLGAEATWQYCQPGKCINDEESLSLELPVGEQAVTDPGQAGLFSEARAALPQALAASSGSSFPGAAGDVLVIRQGKEVTLQISGQTAEAIKGNIAFAPDQPFVAPVDFTAASVEDGTISLPLKQAIDIADKPVPIEGDGISGILLLKDGPAVAIPFTKFGKAPAPPVSFSQLLPILGGMLIGGLILNLMPCVFPVIGLKIMGFVQQAGEDRKKIIFHGLAFTLGVLVSFWILSGILFALRAGAAPGQEIGWGYQLQNPWTILVLMLLMFVLGLSMYGVFEIGASATGFGGSLQSKQGLSGSFFSGILATVVATPCSAPFLGAAIGAAIALPALQFFLAFTFMALGLSLPYLILSIFPKLVEMLPRPGPWMESFKQAMSFLLFATAGFLLWVYTAQIGLGNMLNVVVGLTLIAIAGWIFGRWDTPAKSPAVRWAAKALVVVFAVFGFIACKPPAESSITWDTWSSDKVEELLADGQPVYVDFTAQWCATCQVNKKRAYPEEVATLMKERGIVALKADKTKANPEIDAKLEELGRSAIPVNVLYVPGKEPIITPEILSADYLKDLFTKEVPAPTE
ncbi:thiol:disulfide interchange protein [Haloferula helveola]|uniref:Thiol:disulfide interchange protein n=1 Tax=Haloferula helveola TaxID=490095 RepID=A0ABM7R6J7_9BACT|nr:thiol:disulfide interchange protein [Haloferula helveola]